MWREWNVGEKQVKIRVRVKVRVFILPPATLPSLLSSILHRSFPPSSPLPLLPSRTSPYMLQSTSPGFSSLLSPPPPPLSPSHLVEQGQSLGRSGHHGTHPKREVRTRDIHT